MSVFKSEIEKNLYQWLEPMARKHADESTTGFIEACQELGLPGVGAWAEDCCNMIEANKAGIPMSVILGNTTLIDHFSKEYIDFKTGKRH